MKTLIRLLLVAALLSGGSARAADSAVALMYHRFADDRFPSTNIRTEQLVAQLDYLVENDYTVIGIEDFMKAMIDGAPLPDRAVLITVDDAYQSVFDVGHPLFQQYGFPYTVFVASDPVDDGLNDYMTWDTMRQMQADGVSFANHGASHTSTIDREPDADYLERMAADAEKGMQRLRDELEPVEHVFAYPYGEFNSAVIERLSSMALLMCCNSHIGFHHLLCF